LKKETEFSPYFAVEIGLWGEYAQIDEDEGGGKGGEPKTQAYFTWFSLLYR